MSENENTLPLSSSKNNSSFDLFEFFVAILLGLSALGSAWAGFQASMWGGNMSTAYAEAATIAIKGATEKTDAMIKISQDFQIDIMGKKLLREAKTAPPKEKKAILNMARYLYSWQMSFEAYESLSLPLEKHAEYEEYDDSLTLSEEELYKLALVNDLDDTGNTYEEDRVKDANGLFKKANLTFEAGKGYNTRGDKFTLNGVIYTMALFFAGLALVFKSKVKWVFLAAGSGIFLYSSYLLFSMEWVKTAL